MYKIGIIGKGFVGAAVAQGMSAGVGFNAQIKIYDKDPKRSNHDLDDVLKDSDFLFISVPTPSRKNG